MKNSELYQLAFQCLLNEPGFDEVFKNKIISNEEDFLRFIQVSSNHLILPAVVRRLKNKGFSEYLPVELAEHLNDLLQINIERNNEILQQIEEISRHLGDAGIKPVFMKGTALMLDNLYVDIADRMIGDIDFLVRDEDFLPAAEIAFKLGYKTDVVAYNDIKTLKHYPRLYREDVPADLEIHRLPVNLQYADWFGPEIVFNEKKPIPYKPNYYVSSDKHKLIHTFIHSQLSNKGNSYRIASLRDLYDFYLISKRIDFNYILPEIKVKKKAMSFFSIVQYMFESEISAGSLQYQFNNKYVRQINWFLNHPKQHRFYINFVKAIDIFIERPFLKIKNALLNKSSRLSLIKRLENPDWYKSTYKGIRSFFK